jgi:hypothetical protein
VKGRRRISIKESVAHKTLDKVVFENENYWKIKIDAISKQIVLNMHLTGSLRKFLLNLTTVND